MKQKQWYLLLALFVVLVAVYFIYPSRNQSNNPQGNTGQRSLLSFGWTLKPEYHYDTFAIKEEYEALNGRSEWEWDNVRFSPPMLITEQAQLKNLDFPALQQMLEEGTGVIYFGFPECPRCRRLLPQLIKASISADQIVYMFNPKEIRDQIIVDGSGELIVEKEANTEYQYLLDRLNDFLPVYTGLGDDSIKRLYVPFVLVVKEGNVVGYHNGVLEEYTDPYLSMMPEMKTKLWIILDRLFNATITDETCFPSEDLSC